MKKEKIMINIAKLLKDAPKGMKLYSPLFGEVEFAEVMDTDYVPIRVMKRGYGSRFDEYGRYMGNEYPDSECLLFPSKDCRTWEGWEPPVKPNFKVGDWVVSIRDTSLTYRILEPNVTNEYNEQGELDYKFEIYSNGIYQQTWFITSNKMDEWGRLWTIADAKDGDVLAINWHEDDDSWEKIVIFKKYHTKGVKGLLNRPCVEGYGNTFKNGKLAFNEEVPYYSKTWTMSLQPATKEQRDQLFAKIKEAGYQWDADKKELKKIQPHYDISNFHAGMPVLVREYDTCHWQWVQYSHFNGVGLFFAAGKTWRQCIPFNEDTKHLLGTTDMPSEEYINW